MEKGGIARYEQFLLFPQCFQKACFPGASKGVVVWEWVKQLCSVQSKNRVNSRFVLDKVVIFTLSIPESSLRKVGIGTK